MEKRFGRKKMKDKDKATHSVPVKFTESEHKKLKAEARRRKEPYVSRTVREIVIEFFAARSADAKVCTGDRSGEVGCDSDTGQRSDDSGLLVAGGRA